MPLFRELLQEGSYPPRYTIDGWWDGVAVEGDLHPFG